MSERGSMDLEINGEILPLSFPVHHSLLEVLREEAGLCGTKHGCELGECGACAVLVDGAPLLACLTLAVEMEGRSITTVEGLADGSELHPLQESFADLGAGQCGYCTSGMLLTGKWLLDHKVDATEAEIAEGLSGNLCRCTGYRKIIQAVRLAGMRMRDGAGEMDPEWVYGSSLPKELSHE